MRPGGLKRALKRVLLRGYTHAFWHKDGTNWGDALNPVLIEYLSGRPARFASGRETEKYIVMGSILSEADGCSEVWGAGFISSQDTVVEPPRAVHALRGPHSHARLRALGIDAPEVFGDPALLLPLFFNPEVARQYEVGVVPHVVDKRHPWVERAKSDPAVQFIDVESGTFEFVRRIKACDVILSSSLHGLICADAYGVPSVWMELSNGVLGAGFKFRDYFASTGRDIHDPVRPEAGESVAGVAQKAHEPCTNFDRRRLLRACPFLKPELRAELDAMTVSESNPASMILGTRKPE
jgi:pyruvyltransferase